MKTIFFSLFILSTLPMALHAGNVKDLVIKCDESITQEMSERAGLTVERISDYQFKENIGADIAVQARVAVSHPQSGEISEFMCSVSFAKMNEDYEPFRVECEAL